MAAKICVCGKVVPREAVGLRLDPELHQLDRSIPSEINPPDAYAVEEALQIRDRIGAEVIAVSMGPANGVESLRTALAMGADRAMMVSDALLEGSDLVVTSRVLAAVLARETPDLVVFGSQSMDGGGAMLWAAVAERLGYPVLSAVRDVQLVGGMVRATRTASEADLVLEAPAPCVVALSGSVNTPRYPTFRDIVASKRKEIASLSTADLGLTPSLCGWEGARTKVLSVAAAPPRRSTGTIVQDDGRAAKWLFEFMAQRDLA